MTAPDTAMPADLDLLLASVSVPAMSADLIDRIVAEAARADRVALPVTAPRRSRGRQWTRRGVWSGVVAVNLMLATAVAAAFGGGALTFATIAVVAQHVVQHIRHPFGHAEPVRAPARRPVVHRLAVPAAAIMTAPRSLLPMAAAARSLPPAPVVARPIAPSVGAIPYAHAVRPTLGDRPRPLMAIPHHAAEPHPAALARSRGAMWEARHLPAHRNAARESERHAPSPRSARLEPRTPLAEPVVTRADPPSRAEVGPKEAAPAERGLHADGGTRFDSPRWQAPAAARTGVAGPAQGQGEGQMLGQNQNQNQARGQAQGFGPGWRRRMPGNQGAGAPGWRRRAGMGGGARPGGRIKPPRGGGGRHPRRF